ncbi:MAG: RnfABCDGE type electron transport complex subunit D [Desulfobacteraceae bacterium]|nr:RnfABCDGE type electron transport complex subunit D [Desulfobacteraceae bacterium]
MNSEKKFLVSHAPFWHNGSGVPERNYNIIIAALPAVLVGLSVFGVPALGVICMSVSSAIGWEFAITRLSKRPVTVGDGNAALIGLLFGMLLPATSPWWLVITGTFVAILIGQQIFGGIGGNPFNPPALAFAILSIAWKKYLDFDAQLINFDFNFFGHHPLVAVKAFGPENIAGLPLSDLLLGRQVGGIGAGCGLALILGGVYLIARGFVRWEIPIAFIVGLFVTAGLFHMGNPAKYADPLFHLLAGNTLLGAFFLITDDSSSPVNLVPMLIYGLMGGMMVILIRNIGIYPDGVINAVLVINLLNPLLDKIRPKALGKAA